jgi:hypothetical protein
MGAPKGSNQIARHSFASIQPDLPSLFFLDGASF